MGELLNKLLLNRSCLFILLLALLLVSLIGFTDLTIGYEFSFSIFYIVPIALVAWYGCREGAIAMPFIAAVIWLAVDILSGHQYPHELIQYWNALVRLGYFLIIARLLMLIKHRLQNEEIMADTDALTGLWNKRYFNEMLQAEINRNQRYNIPFTLVYLDLDNFKQVNDTQGHDTGDDVLCTVSETIKTCLRQSDIAARLGGDEFACLCLDTGYDDAEIIIDKVQTELNAAMKQHDWQITFSIGMLSITSASNATSRDIVKATDTLMYQVKKKGKNALIHRRWEDLQGLMPATPPSQ